MVFRDVYNIELNDSHFANEEYFKLVDNTNSKITIPHLPRYIPKALIVNSYVKMVKEIRVVPQQYGDHIFEPATYKYSHSKEDSASTLVGISTNKPQTIEIMTLREYKLSSGLHFVSLQTNKLIGRMELFRYNQFNHCCLAFLHLVQL